MATNILEIIGFATVVIAGFLLPPLLYLNWRGNLIKDADEYVRDKYGLKQRKGWDE